MASYSDTAFDIANEHIKSHADSDNVYVNFDGLVADIAAAIEVAVEAERQAWIKMLSDAIQASAASREHNEMPEMAS